MRPAVKWQLDSRMKVLESSALVSGIQFDFDRDPRSSCIRFELSVCLSFSQTALLIGWSDSFPKEARTSHKSSP